MRKKRILLSLLLVLLLTGCAGRPPVSDERAAEAGLSWEGLWPTSPEESAATEGSMSASLVEAQARPLSEGEILDAYERAVTAYSWFVLTPLPDTGETVLHGNAAYRRVDARGMTELDDLKAYLNGIFSPEVTERLLDTDAEYPMYRDIDGALYVTGSGRTKDPYKGDSHVLVEQVSDTEYAVNVAVDLLDEDQVTVTGLEYWSFTYAFTGDRWVFTDFRLIY